MKRINRFLLRILLVSCILVFIGGVIYFIQITFHVFDSQIKQVVDWVAYVNQAGSYSLIAGVSFGSIFFILAAGFFPFFLRGVNRKSYWASMQRGLIASFVFYISQIIYKYASSLGRIYFYIAIFAVIVVTLILIEIITLGMKEEKKEAESMRTDIIASITSGLIFGVLIRVVEVGLHEVKNLLSFMP